MLQNKAGFWKGKHEWNFKIKLNSDDLIYIENIKPILGIKITFILEANNGAVMLETDVEENKAEQLWQKGNPDAKGYFILVPSLASSVTVPKVITAISENDLEIKGIT